MLTKPVHTRVASRAFLLSLLCACSSERAFDAEEGSLSLRLRTEVNGVAYRLRDAELEITGPESVSLRSEDEPDTVVLRQPLQVGDYEIELDAGWRLEREGSLGFEAVPAVLASPARLPFSITRDEVTAVAYDFRTEQTSVGFSEGALEVRLRVTDSELCGFAGTLLRLDDENPCTVDRCDPEVGVRHDPAPDGGACDDANACTGPGVCAAGECQMGEALPLPDLGPCGRAVCDRETGSIRREEMCEISCEPAAERYFVYTQNPAPVVELPDLWQLVDYPEVPLDLSGQPPAWQFRRDGNGDYVNMNVFTRPNLLISPFDVGDTVIRGSLEASSGGTSGPMGLVLGYRDRLHYYLFEWYQAGMRLRRVDMADDDTRGAPAFLPLGQQVFIHGDLYADEGVEVRLVRDAEGNPYVNDVTWRAYSNYHVSVEAHAGGFRLIVSATQGGPVLEDWTVIAPDFEPGRFGYYSAYSQTTRYHSFRSRPTPRACSSFSLGTSP